MTQNNAAVRFDGRVAIVTGGGSGLGRDYAHELARRGAAVVVNDLGTDPQGRHSAGDSGSEGESRAEQVAAEIRAAGGRAAASTDSCATAAGGQAIVEAAMAAFGRVDILIHNAGFLRNAPFETMTEEEVRSILDVHLMGGFHVGQPAYRIMQRQGYGRFVLVSSASGVFGARWQANYAAAKMGLIGLMHVLALEGAAHGIRANALLPCGNSRMGRTPEQWPADFFSMSAADYALVSPAIRNDQVVPMAVWLASEACMATHAIYTATAGRFGRVFIGEARGLLVEPDAPPSVEDIAAHWDRIEDHSDFCEGMDLWDEMQDIANARKAARAAGA